MTDGFGRTVDYMRISITDRCNLRCSYCMPKEPCWLPKKTFKERGDSGNLSLSGKAGNPKNQSHRRRTPHAWDCAELIREIKSLPGIEKVTLTTNGVLLAKKAQELYEAGIDGVNVSLDTLDRNTYQEMTGFDRLSQVLEGLEVMGNLPVPLKTNTVLMPGVNEEAWKELALLAKKQSIDVRFIEKMPLGEEKGAEGISNLRLLEDMQKLFGKAAKDSRVHGNWRAVHLSFSGISGQHRVYQCDTREILLRLQSSASDSRGTC